MRFDILIMTGHSVVYKSFNRVLGGGVRQATILFLRSVLKMGTYSLS